jgi:hypothetical protein
LSIRLRWLISSAVIFAVLLLLGVMMGSPTEAQDQKDRKASSESRGGNVVSDSISAAEQTDARTYWTPERMRNAKPLDMTISRSPGSSTTGAAAQPQGRPVKLPPTAPNGGPASGAGASATGIQPAATTSNGYTYPYPFTRYEVVDPGSTSYTAYPYSTNGKVFFTKASGGNFVCSGTVVNTQRSSTDLGNRSTIWTAGHCVSDGNGNFHTNWVFVPAYRDNVRPFGTWSARALTTKSEWHSFSNFEQDVGAAVLNTQSGVAIQNRVGSEGIAFNQAYPQHWHAFGYPQAAPFNGQRQHACAASYARQDDPSPRTNVPSIGIGCDMTGGASGGGWILRFGFGGGWVNSVNSYKYITPAEPLAMYGPYHGNDALSLFNSARIL